MIFTIEPKDLRREVYANFEVIEPELNGQPVFLCTCRSCRRQVLTIVRNNEINATPLIVALEHKKACEAAKHKQ